MFLKMAEARSLGVGYRNRVGAARSASILQDSVNFSEGKTYDVFLSHSFADADVVLGVYAFLVGKGKTVYVDWIEDKGLDRAKVTPATADVLRKRMRSSLSLVYASSNNAEKSKWMPWELGFFDAYRPGTVSIMPLVENYDSEWQGQEYLGLYPVIDQLELGGRREAFLVKASKAAMPLSDLGKLNPSYIWKDVGGRAA